MTYSKPIFDLFDNNYNNYYTSNIMQQQQAQQINDISTSPTSKRIHPNLSSSSTSINSIFDGIPSRSISTTTITPVLSRHNSSKHKIDYDFTKIIDSKLKEVTSSLKLVILLVGLPASGKSTICNQLNQHINNHTKFSSRIFNAGDVRRRNSDSSDSSFFNPNNLQGVNDREKFATITVQNLIHLLVSNEIDCGFLDATNTTRERRNRMIKLINNNISNVKIVILDVRCNDNRLLNYNIAGKTTNSDYKNKDYELAIKDFKMRTEHYKKVYQPITKSELENYENLSLYVKVMNGGQEFEIETIRNDNEQDDDYKDWVDILNGFKDDYYELEGKKYLEMVNRWYN
ncbi:unnamed protein product [Candida verbasci]|uniref:6-phosphofructo-2-kinase domain-containing protein n=1 Tax=Candida verbasci TaxID=1227364 RepID=A0A9W4TUX0_9ASCO|nr:unnamed protein product [Candida verbasci]